ncbi:MAG: protein translocase subunit SecD, partial [Pseudomonadota bacterium]|nr:protein translocase subunit SecD [Pseudomonadota bacterium]
MLHFSNLKIIGIGLIVFLGFLFSSPNFMDERTRLQLPGFLPGGQLNLGLDLQGGSHLLLEVDTGVVQSERVEEIVSDVRQALRGRQIGYTGLGRLRDGVTVTIRDANDV